MRSIEGSCGDNVNWIINDDGTLTLFGTGEMFNYSDSLSAPWNSNLSSIKAIIIENGVTSVGDEAFNGCINLASVTLSSSLISIGSNAFYGCTHLTDVTVPESVSSIGNCVFCGCTRLRSIQVKEGNMKYRSIDGVLFSLDASVILQYPIGNTTTVYTIPNGVTTIGSSSFARCTSLTNIIIPDSVKTIDSSAFARCSSLGNVSLPDHVVSIGYEAFYACTKIATVTIPDSVETIGNCAFCDCTGLVSIEVKKRNTMFKSIDGVLFTNDLSTIIQYPAGNTRTSYSIPDNVTSIGSSAFARTVGLTEVVVPNSTTAIGSSAFARCSNLACIIIPKSVTSIGSSAFYSCTNLENVVLPDGVESIGTCAFCGCTNLKSIQVKEGNTKYKSVDGVLFTHDFSMIIQYPPADPKTSYNIPYGVTTIGSSSFARCTSLTNIIFPDSVTTIGNSAFARCSSLGNVSLPDSLISIGSSAFYGCTDLRDVTIPDGVMSIGSSAFEACSNLTYVFYQGSQTILEPVFLGCDALVCVCVSPDYHSPSFCGKTVNLMSNMCKQFQDLFNHCFKGMYVHGKLIEQKRRNATEWEERNDDCGYYQCDIDSGAFAWSLCNSTDAKRVMCISDKCVTVSNKFKDKVRVEIELVDGVSIQEVDTTVMLEAIKALCRVDVKDMVIGWETNEQGHIARFVVYVNDEQTAEIMVKRISEMEKGERCQQGILCKTKRVHIIEEQFISGATNILVMNMLFVLLFRTMIEVTLT